MKNLIKKMIFCFETIILSVLAMYLGISCSKSNSGSGTMSHMQWVYQGNTIISTSDTAFEFANTIDGYSTSANQHVEVSLQGTMPGPGLATGTYLIGGGPNNVYIWLGSNLPIGASSGQVIITSKTTDVVSGTFDVVLSNSQHLSGTMTQVPID